MKRTTAHTHGKQSQDYRKLLLAKKAELLSNLEDVRFDTIAKMGRVAEEDQAQLSHEEFISLRRNSLDYQQLKLVQQALDRLASGDYGVCQACEEPIPAKRLHALPWAKYCIGCQERHAFLQSEQRDRAESSADAHPTW